jgi:predicted ester cyclase
MNSTELIARLYELVDERPFNQDATQALFAESFSDHNRPEAPDFLTDTQVTMGLFSELAEAFPDGRHELVTVSKLEDDKAMVYWRFSGTHQKPFFGTEAHGNAVCIYGVDIFQVGIFHDGEPSQFVAQWHVEQLAQLAAQLLPL